VPPLRARSGKNLTISKGSKVNATAADGADGAAAPPKKAPWILRVLGLDDVESADDEDFWEAPAATVRKDEGPNTGGGGADASGGDSPADGPSDGAGGDDGPDDDTDDLDTLDDLLG
jgi:hypothetical protein